MAVGSTNDRRKGGNRFSLQMVKFVIDEIHRALNNLPLDSLDEHQKQLLLHNHAQSAKAIYKLMWHHIR